LRKRELTPAQKEYRSFDVRRGYIVGSMVVFLVLTLICFGVSLSIVDENPKPLLLFTGILVVLTLIIIFICRYLVRKGERLYIAAYGNNTDIIRNGLFGELWQEFEWNQYEGLTDGKVVFAQTHNNTIDLQIIRHKHEFSVEITSDGLYLICDEETDAPIEKEIPLSDLMDVGEVFLAIREFIEINS
jgi:hypothetical protein